MRLFWLLLLVPLAGCIDGSSDPAPVAEPAPVSGLPAGAELAELDWQLQLCDHGYRVLGANASAPADGRACDFRVTKPLTDPALFDWTTQHGPGNEVSMAVNPADPLNLAGGAKDYTVSYISDVATCGEFTVWNGHFWSTDGGRTWGNDLIPGFPGDPRESPLAGNLCNTDPVSVFDSDGTYWHNGLNYRGTRDDVGDPTTPLGSDGLLTGSQIFFARSPPEEKAATFDRITTASFGDNEPTIFNDKNWLAVDPDSDHMIHTWTNFYAGIGGVIEYVESFDGGATWTLPVPMPAGVTLAGINGGVTGVEVPVAVVQFSMPQYDSAGNVWVIWSGLNGPVITHAERPVAGLASVFLPPATTVSYPAGGLGGSGCLSKTSFRTSVYPVLGIDTSGTAHDGRKYITYPAAGPGGDSDVYVTWSDDGTSWSEPTIVTGPEDQFMAWLDVGPDGTVHVAYYDCQHGDGRTMTLGYAFSSDGGATWQTGFQVGQVHFDGDLGHHQSGAPFIGDYIAVDASASGVHFFWADTRHGRSDVYAATVIKDASVMDLYAPELA